MKAARKNLPAAERVEHGLDDGKLARANAAAAEIGAADMAVIESAELFKAVGRIETAHFYETVSSRLLAEQYLKAKALIGKSGPIPYLDASGRAKHVSSLDEFCEVFLKLSQRRCQQLVSDVAVLGPELYDQAQRIGFKARDYQALKALPEEAQEVVKQALASGTKEAALDALHELALRNAALHEKVADDAQTIEAKEKIIAKRDAKISKLEERAELEGEAAQLAEIQERIRALVAAALQLGNVVLDLDDAGISEEMRTMVNADCEYAAQTFAEILQRAGIPVQFEEMVDPSWMKGKTGKKAAKGA